MRRIVTGTGPDGRSMVMSDDEPSAKFRFGQPGTAVDPHTYTGSRRSREVDTPGPAEVIVAELWSTVGVPTRSHRDPTEGYDTWDVECSPGTVKWRMVHMGPERLAPIHSTKTLDFNTIVSGTVDLWLETGAVRLGAGDTVVLPGTAHGWQTGDTGCHMSITMIGLDGQG